MTDSLSVLFVSSEVMPFSKIGGIADVSAALPLALRELGHDVRVMTPKYGPISERKNRIHEINRLKNIKIPLGDSSEEATVKSSSISNTKVKVQAYITTNDRYFEEKKGFYHDPKTWEEYPDNHERFMFFNRAVIETCLLLGWKPDLIHCNDWRAGLIPALVKELFAKEFKNTKVVLTIHNFNAQGAFEKLDPKKTNLPDEAIKNYMFDGKFNFLKGAIHYADYVTTVSPTYAEEILSGVHTGGGLNEELKKKKFVGILNGIDSYAWNPKKDAKIAEKLKGDVEEFKLKNKAALLKTHKLDDDLEAPLIGMVARLDEQKGVKLFIEAADEILSENVRMVLLGLGDVDLRDEIMKISEKYPDKFIFKYTYSEELAHQIEAAADIYLISSKYEPCGLNLLYSLQYGAVPVVRLTGGLKDVAKEYEKETKTGNSFVFTNYEAGELVDALKRALQAYKDKEAWLELVKRNIERDYSWSESAKKYDEIYESLTKE